MNEFLITIVFIIVLVFGVYSYATYLTKSGKAEDADGNFIGMAKFRRPIISLFFTKISRLVENNNFDSYYTAAIELMIKDNKKINYVKTNNLPWMDIDEQDEFEVAKKLFYKMREINS